MATLAWWMGQNDWQLVGGTPVDDGMSVVAIGDQEAVDSAHWWVIDITAEDGSVLRATNPAGWGIDSNGEAYYDTAGAQAGELALLSRDVGTGSPVLTR